MNNDENTSMALDTDNEDVRGLDESENDDIDIDDSALSIKKYKQSIIRFNAASYETAKQEQERLEKLKKMKEEKDKKNKDKKSNSENENINESNDNCNDNNDNDNNENENNENDENDSKMEIIDEVDDIGPMFELTIKEASLSPVLSMKQNWYDAEKYSIAKYFENIVNSRLVMITNTPDDICEIISQYCVTLPYVKMVNHDIMGLVVQYLKHHNGIIPREIAKPIRSVKMERIVDDRWDATFIDKMSKKTIFQVILAANYLGLSCLLHLGSAKIATLIKGKTPQEIKIILADESDEKATSNANDTNVTNDTNDTNGTNDTNNSNNTNSKISTNEGDIAMTNQLNNNNNNNDMNNDNNNNNDESM